MWLLFVFHSFRMYGAAFCFDDFVLFSALDANTANHRLSHVHHFNSFYLDYLLTIFFDTFSKFSGFCDKFCASGSLSSLNRTSDLTKIHLLSWYFCEVTLPPPQNKQPFDVALILPFFTIMDTIW